MKSLPLTSPSPPLTMSPKRKLPTLTPSSPPPPPTPPPTLFKPKPETRKSLTHKPLNGWHPLPIPRSELSLPLTLPTGQSFRWRQTSHSPFIFTGVIGPHLLSLRHVDSSPDRHVAFLHHNPSSSPISAVQSAIFDYFNFSTNLGDLWKGFADVDERFAEVAGRFEGGARVMRQDPLECLFQFLCSSNNNIARIEKMVGVMESFGRGLGRVGGVDFYEFPTVERLGEVTEKELREAGFGYRAKYIVGTVKALQAKPGGGAEWLTSLRDMELNEAIEALCTLPGVGPKVAACIALFSLDQHHAIPVDTHVWQIATRYLLPELAGVRLTSKLCTKVSEAFVSKFGKYAGWAQNVLFIAELPSQKALVATLEEPETPMKKHRKKKVAIKVLMEGT